MPTGTFGSSKKTVRKDLLRQAVADNVRTITGDRSRVKRSKRVKSSVIGLTIVGTGLLFAAYLMPRLVADSGSEIALTSNQPFVTASLPDTGLAGLSPEDKRWTNTTPIASSVFPVAVRRIVIDPGHGGRDGGSSTRSGLLEKDLTLDIGLKLRDLLVADGEFEVVMTRDTDHFVALKERAKLANEVAADLFLSIHLNWFEPATQRGVETFFLGPTEDPILVELTSRENLESGYSLADVRTLLDGIYLDLRQEQSQKLATALQATVFREARKGRLGGKEPWSEASSVLSVGCDGDASCLG